MLEDSGRWEPKHTFKTRFIEGPPESLGVGRRRREKRKGRGIGSFLLNAERLHSNLLFFLPVAENFPDTPSFAGILACAQDGKRAVSPPNYIFPPWKVLCMELESPIFFFFFPSRTHVRPPFQFFFHGKCPTAMNKWRAAAPQLCFQTLFGFWSIDAFCSRLLSPKKD